MPIKSVSKKVKKPIFIVNTETNELIGNENIFTINGYDFADRLLEGVMFKAKLSEDGKELTVIGTNSDDYLEDLNSSKWMKVALSRLIQIAEEGDFVYPENNSSRSDWILATEEILKEHYPGLFKKG